MLFIYFFNYILLFSFRMSDFFFDSWFQDSIRFIVELPVLCYSDFYAINIHSIFQIPSSNFIHSFFFFILIYSFSLFCFSLFFQPWSHHSLFPLFLRYLFSLPVNTSTFHLNYTLFRSLFTLFQLSFYFSLSFIFIVFLFHSFFVFFLFSSLFVFF